MPTAPIVDMLATYANHYRRPPRPVPPEGVLQRKLANEESVSLELFRPALRLARHRNLLGPGGPELTERRTAFVEEVRAVTRRLAVIADIARSKGETR
jgi:glycerol-3-phosphate O-acyltransferase